MGAPSFLCLLALLSLASSSLSSSPPPPTTITLPLSHFHPNPSPDPYQNLTHIAIQSKTRAHHLKNPQTAPATTTTPISAHSYGAYSIPLSFGTPPQTLKFVMDTGSDIVWFPCTRRYQCTNCSFGGSDSSNLTLFIPKLSSSAKILGCLNPKCGWIHHTNVTNCRDCEPNLTNCTQICPPYMIFYGSGTTGGLGLAETLDFPAKKVPDFVVGCSIFSVRQPAGIAGFGRGPASLPSQLGLNKFSYCLLPRKFDETAKTTALVLESGSDSGEQIDGVSYSPFVKNPIVAGKDAFSVYYYISLRKITVGGKTVKIPYEYLSPSGGGAIVDSGSTFTYMSRNVFEPVMSEFVNQMKKYKRASEVEIETGIGPCFVVSGGGAVTLPELKLQFKGGAELVPPLENYFILAGKRGAVCLAVVTDDGFGPAASSDGPAIILGNFQMQNFYVEYDLKNDRFGFRKQTCN
ncbi:Aspartyl protease precursor [Actinidia chinensis var. chinensis]|uniref:Aspartyl protease n=1 Tax=Actinidia chinensis var. chinensis TaxID=1590841 RepID=A0A2R6PEL3_ACTCC|nr:Aspartyl protease precursor [Actinidia chinensis var. chinensis]